MQAGSVVMLILLVELLESPHSSLDNDVPWCDRLLPLQPDAGLGDNDTPSLAGLSGFSW